MRAVPSAMVALTRLAEAKNSQVHKNWGTRSSPFPLQPPLYCWKGGPDLYLSSGASLGQRPL